jgi:hypothetical protein
MRKILVMLVAIAMFAGFAMAETKDIGEMTALEKYNYARTLYCEGDLDGWRQLCDEVKDDESLPRIHRAYAWRFSGRPTQERFEGVKALGFGVGTDHYETLLVNMAIGTEGEEQIKLVNEIVDNADDFVYPYFMTPPFLRVLESLGREDDMRTIGLAALSNAQAIPYHISQAFRVVNVKEGLDILISSLPGRRKRADFVPKQDEAGKLVGNSIITLAIDMVEGNYDTLTYAERTDFRRRIDGQLGMSNPVHRILKEAIRSAQEADRKAQELFE